MYKIGEKVVYPVHGAGTVEAIEKKSVLGQNETFYIIRMMSNGMKLMIPVKNEKSAGIRTVTGKQGIKKILNILGDSGSEIERDWKLRYENNVNKVKSNNIAVVAEVVRDLFQRGSEQELSTMERRLYENAYNLVAYEVALSKEVDIEIANNIVSEALSEN